MPLAPSRARAWANLYGVDPMLQRLVDAHPLIFRGQLPRCHSYLEPDWYELVDRLLTAFEDELGAEGCKALKIEQVKEKFGSLRVHFLLPDRLRQAHGARLRELLDEAELRSEALGKFG
jgi:hypothetical protein